MFSELAELEAQLQTLSHDQTAIDLIKKFAEKLGKTKKRQIVFGSEGALFRQPILYQEVLERGLIIDDDPFILLQGDIISTDTAYFFGERLEGMKFAIASSTCDLVPERRENEVLFRIESITKTKYSDDKLKEMLSQLLKFNSTKYMYLPPLPNDSDDVIANCIVFDGVVQIRLDDLLMATRHASLSLVGWRIFGSLLRTIMVRAGESEIKMRTAF